MVSQSNLGQSVSILANLGVLAGIVFLAIEVRQNQASLEEGNRINVVSASTSALEYFSEFRSLVSADSELAEIWFAGRAGQPLSGAEALRFDYVCRNLFWANAILHERFVAFGREQGAAAAIRDTRNGIEQFPGLAECWRTLSEQIAYWGYEDFVQGVEAAGQ